MTNKEQEWLAKKLLGTVRDVWCEIDESTKSGYIEFNCKRCEFETAEGKCLIKKFMLADHFKQEDQKRYIYDGGGAE